MIPVSQGRSWVLWTDRMGSGFGVWGWRSGTTLRDPCRLARPPGSALDAELRYAVLAPGEGFGLGRG